MKSLRGALPLLALPALALACALVANGFASPARHLRWIGAPPPLPAPQGAAPAPAAAAEPVKSAGSPRPAAEPKPASRAAAAPVADLVADPAHPVREISSEEA